MGEPRKPNLYDVGICGRVPGPQNQLVVWATRTPGQTIRKHIGTIWNYYFINIEVPEVYFCRFEKRRAPENPENLFT